MDSHTGPNMELIMITMDAVHDPVDIFIKSHWGDNILINRLSELAVSALQEYQPQLNRRVAALGDNIDPFHAEIAHLVSNRMIAQLYDRNVRWDSENTLHPTFLSWLKNLNALSTLINRLSEDRKSVV